MNKWLENIKNAEANLQTIIAEKIKDGTQLSDYEVSHYKLTDDDAEILKIFDQIKDGNEIEGFKFKDFLASPQAKVLVPRVIIGAMRQAAEPVYIASKMFKPMKLKAGGEAILFPSIAPMKAHDVGATQEIPEETADWDLHKGDMIKIGKVGIRLAFSEELLSEVEWDVVKLFVQEAGRAMARHSEEKAFQEFDRHKWVVFDNTLKDQDPIAYKDAGTTGVDFANNLNDTMSIDDYLDLLIACYDNGYVPTDMIMHALAWPSFARNGLTGAYTAYWQNNSKPEMPNATFKIGPDSLQGRLPFSFNVDLSPFAPINVDNKTFNITVCDRNNVGVRITKNGMRTEEFREPARDITNTKVVDYYGYGTYNQGRAVCQARNVSMARTYSLPTRQYIVNK